MAVLPPAGRFFEKQIRFLKGIPPSVAALPPAGRFFEKWRFVEINSVFYVFFDDLIGFNRPRGIRNRPLGIRNRSLSIRNRSRGGRQLDFKMLSTNGKFKLCIRASGGSATGSPAESVAISCLG